MSDIKVNPCNKCWNQPDFDEAGYIFRCVPCKTIRYDYRSWQTANPLPGKPLTEAEIQKAVRIMPDDYDADAGEISNEIYDKKDDPVKVETYPCRSCGGTPSGLANMWICCGVAYGSQAEWNENNPLKAEPESLPVCWCGQEWIRVGPELVHPLNDCVMDGRRLTGKQIRFLFGENPRVKVLEDTNRFLRGETTGLMDQVHSLESQLTQERMTASPLRGDIDILRAERDALQAKLDALPADKSAKLAEELAALHRENYRHLRMLACVLDKK